MAGEGNGAVAVADAHEVARAFEAASTEGSVLHGLLDGADKVAGNSHFAEAVAHAQRRGAGQPDGIVYLVAAVASPPAQGRAKLRAHGHTTGFSIVVQPLYGQRIQHLKGAGIGFGAGHQLGIYLDFVLVPGIY